MDCEIRIRDLKTDVLPMPAVAKELEGIGPF